MLEIAAGGHGTFVCLIRRGRVGLGGELNNHTNTLRHKQEGEESTVLAFSAWTNTGAGGGDCRIHHRRVNSRL